MTSLRNEPRDNRSSIAEDRIMSRWDAGMSIERIADDINANPFRVRCVVSNHCVNRHDKWEDPVREATDQLAQRILEVHGRQAA